VTTLCFFNFYHNGDLYHSKPFVREVIRALGKEKVCYAHNKDPRAIEDLSINQLRIEGISDKTKIFKSTNPDTVFINTWIGSYFDRYEGECTLLFNMKMWADIYSEINSMFNTNLKLNSIENYLPYVDYRKFNVDNVKTYLNEDKKKKVLFCNGPALSGQCQYNGDMNDVINECAKVRSDLTFITTHKIVTDLPNIIHTSDIIRSDRCDLNEISYLSKFCGLIIGRNSGPFCFASTGENLNDTYKTFYAFGERHSDCFTMGVPIKSNYIFEKYENYDKIKCTISELIEQQ
jgi:hypothetical protein